MFEAGGGLAKVEKYIIIMPVYFAYYAGIMLDAFGTGTYYAFIMLA